MRALLVMVLVCMLGAGSALAQVPQAVWDAFRERAVVVEKKDGTEVSGKLISVEAQSVAVLKPDGQVVVVEKAAIAKLRGGAEAVLAPPAPFVPPPQQPQMMPPPQMLPPPQMAPPVPGPSRYMEMFLLVKTTPPVELVGMLGKQKAAFAALTAEERYALMMRFKETIGSKIVGFVMNWILLPGSGSIYQGDKGYGYPLLAGGLLGLGFMVGGAAHSLQSFSNSGVPLMLAGAAIWYTAALIGMIRPWFYEGIRYSVLKDFYAHPDRFTSGLPALRAPSILPTLLAQPIGLPTDDRPAYSGHNLYGAGLIGSF